MATPADTRLLELLDKWLESLELHTKYASLDDDSYWKIQPWVEHQRPTRWILDLAKQKTIALKSQVEERIKMGDSKFADSLELMTFLANLVGSEHIERFIPVAAKASERSPALEPPDQDTTATVPEAATGTREMPQFTATKRASAPASNAQIARAERKPAAQPKAAAREPAAPAAPAKGAGTGKSGSKSGSAARDQVIADAARLVQWGRKWFELPELIARMADRPPLPEVRRILKENKAAIDKKAGVA